MPDVPGALWWWHGWASSISGPSTPTWLGIEKMPGLSDEVRRRWPVVTGPLGGPVGEWAALLPCLNATGSLVQAMQAVAPRGAELARAVASRLGRGADLPDTASQALERVWDLVTNRQG